MGWQGGNTWSKAREHRALSRAPEAAREPQQPELLTDVQTEPSCSCIHPQSIHTASRGKIEWKMSVCAFGLPRFSGGRAFAAKNVSNQAWAHQISTCIYISLGKERWKMLPSACNHHVLRTNNFGFFQERAPNQQSQ